jgi:hypothetical protein
MTFLKQKTEINLTQIQSTNFEKSIITFIYIFNWNNI